MGEEGLRSLSSSCSVAAIIPAGIYSTPAKLSKPCLQSSSPTAPRLEASAAVFCGSLRQNMTFRSGRFAKRDRRKTPRLRGESQRALFPSLKPITHARFRDDEFRPRRVGFNFVAQMGDINAQVVRVFVMALSPNFAENLTVCENFSGVANKKSKKVVFRDGEFHFATAHSDAPGRQVHDQLARLKHDRVLLLRRMAQSHSKSRQKFARVERFGHVVISAGVEGRDFTGFVVLHGENEHRR